MAADKCSKLEKSFGFMNGRAAMLKSDRAANVALKLMTKTMDST